MAGGRHEVLANLFPPARRSQAVSLPAVDGQKQEYRRYNIARRSFISAPACGAESCFQSAVHRVL